MANDFYIEPAGNLMKGLAVLGDALENRTAVIRDKAIKEQAMDIFKNGNPDEMAQFLVKYPEASKGIEAATNFKNDKTKQNMRDTALNVLLDPDNAKQYLYDRYMMVSKEGGDPNGTLSMMKLFEQDPALAKKRAEMALAAFDRPTWEAYKESTRTEWKPYGYDKMYNPQSGEIVDINPKPTAAAKDPALSNLGKLLKEQAQYEKGSKEWLSYQKRIDEEKKNKGAVYNATKVYAVTDNHTGQRRYVTGAVLADDTSGRYTPLAGDTKLAQEKSEARQRGGARAAAISTANELYQENAPELIELRKKIARRNIVLPNNIKSVNEFNMWFQEHTGDPDVAELMGKATLLAENLQRTVGGGVGEWTFRITKDLLNPALSPEAFERRLQSHAKDISKMATTSREFGKNPVSKPFHEKPKQALDPKKEKTEWIRAARKANPDATPEQLDAAYRIKKGGQ